MYNEFKNIHHLEGAVIKLSKIGDRIKTLRKAHKLSQEEFGKQFGIVKSTVSLYENGKSTPDDEIKKKICEHYGVSMDWLYGLVSVEHIDIDQSGFFMFDFEFTDRFNHLCREKHISEYALAQKLGLTEQNINWLKRGCPDLRTLIAIADYFHVSIDYLIGRTSIKNISSEDEKLLLTFRQLNEDNRDIVIGDIKKIHKEQRRESVAADSTPPEKTGTDSLGK